MGSRKKKKKRDKKKRPRPPKARLRPPGLPGNVEVIATPRGQRKMSEVLLEFLAPYSEYWRNEEQFKKLLAVALVAWNASLLPGSERADFIQRMVATVPPEVRQDMRSIVDEMIQRKEAYFADERRNIISYELTMTPSGP